MRRLLLCLIVLVSLGLFTATVSGQVCPTQDMAEGLTELAGRFEIDDPAMLLREIENLEFVLPAYVGACVSEESLSTTLPEPKEGLAFSLEGEGQEEDTILSDVEIPTGTYRVEMVTNGSFAPRFSREDACSASPDFIRLLNGQGTQGAEFLFRSFDCTETFTIRASADWRLDFYPISTDVYEPLQEAYASETQGLMPIIGPMRIPDGMYIATIISEGPISVDLKPISGQCTMSHGESYLFRFSTSATPHLRTVVTSNNCFTYIIFGLAYEPWTLTFEPLQ